MGGGWAVVPVIDAPRYGEVGVSIIIGGGVGWWGFGEGRGVGNWVGKGG